MKAYMFNTKRQVLKHFSDHVFYNKPDIIFVCTHRNRTAEVIDFDSPAYFLNPYEEVENTIMYKFLANKNSTFAIVQSELLSIPNIKEMHSILGEHLTFFGIFNCLESGDKFLSSYYLDREYA